MVQIPGYKITEKVGEGAISIVYRGIAENNRKPVILKFLKARYPSPMDLARFIAEYELIKGVDSEFIVKTYGTVVSSDGVAIVLEDFDGTPLSTLIKNGEVDYKLFLNISLRLTYALEVIHKLHIVHNDIKPDNILINRSLGKMKVTDFSLSSLFTLDSHDVLEGTLPYISPEQTGRMNRMVDYRTDFYSLGVTLYELTTGRLPFDFDEPIELIHAHLAERPVPPCEINHEIPQIYSDIIMKLMEKNAEDRYQNTLGLRRDLENCAVQLKKNRAVELFELGQGDISDKFTVSQKLFGREEEVESLKNAVEQTGQTDANIMLVKGHAGIGKSSLIYEIQKPLARKKGYFISGKFEQFRQNIPYSALIQAFSALMKNVLYESEDRVRKKKESIQKAVGDNGQVLIDVIPELELIIGKQPPVIDLAPVEAQNRFLFVFLSFIKVFAKPEHPLILFLDDLQWSDLASLKLIQALLMDNEIIDFLIIGAYRDTEIDATHPLQQMFFSVLKEDKTIRSITLGPISEYNINQLLSESFKKSLSETEALAAIVYNKTGGNPFFVNEFLKTLYSNNLITFREDGWVWVINQIKGASITDNVANLMTEKIDKLPVSTREALMNAACLGINFNLEILRRMRGISVDRNYRDLKPAADEGLIRFKKETGNFVHDRILEAAYSLIDIETKKRLHFLAAKIYIDMNPADKFQDLIFYIVNQFNEALDLLDEKGRIEVAEYNLHAGLKARASAAFKEALNYFFIGNRILPENAWSEYYTLTLHLRSELAEAEYLNTNFDRAFGIIEEVITHAKSDPDRIRVYELKISMLTVQFRFLEALEAGRSALKRIGIKIPEKANDLSPLPLIFGARLKVGQRSIESLINMPIMSDELKLGAMRLMITMYPAAYIASPKLAPVIAMKMVNFSLKHGNSAYSAYAFAIYGVILSAALGEYEKGLQFGQLAIKITDRFNATALKCKVNFLYGAFISHQSRPLDESFPYLETAYKSGLETGDLEFTGYSIDNYCIYNILKGNSIEKLEEMFNEFRMIMLRIDQANSLQWFNMFHQCIMNLKYVAEEPTKLVGKFFDEDEYVPYWRKANNQTNLYGYNVIKSLMYILFDQFDAAVKTLEDGFPYEGGALGMALVQMSHFLYGIASAALIDKKTNNPEKNRYKKNLQYSQKICEKWGESSPVNYLSRSLLIDAEVERIRGDFEKAEKLYNQSIDVAIENGNLIEEALANLAVVRFRREVKSDDQPGDHLMKAYFVLSRWGAISVLNYLEVMYPEVPIYLKSRNVTSLVQPGVKKISPASQDTGAFSTGKSLDLTTVIRASQILSEEIFLDKLLEKVLNIMVENAGAERGCLVLEHDDELFIEAYGPLEDGNLDVMSSVPLQSSDMVPPSVIQYVKRTGESVVLGNAAEEGIFTNAPYILSKQPRSILCIPIFRQKKFTAVLYLENNLVTNAFTPERIELLNILLTQVAISIENARLIKEETEKQTLQKEMDLAKNVQLSILPDLTGDELFDITAALIPARSVGGDYYDFVKKAGKRWIAMGDVTGHGLNSGLMMMMAQTAFSSYLNTSPDPRLLDLFSVLNETLYDNMVVRTKQDLYMTFIALSVENDGTVHHIGKHDDILVYRNKSDKVEVISSDGIWMGVIPDVQDKVKLSSFYLDQHDFIVLFTDGIIESRNEHGEQFGKDRLIAKIEENASDGIKVVKDAILNSCFEFMNKQDDDVSLFIIQKK